MTSGHDEWAIAAMIAGVAVISDATRGLTSCQGRRIGCAAEGLTARTACRGAAGVISGGGGQRVQTQRTSDIFQRHGRREQRKRARASCISILNSEHRRHKGDHRSQESPTPAPVKLRCAEPCECLDQSNVCDVAGQTRHREGSVGSASSTCDSLGSTEQAGGAALRLQSAMSRNR